MAVGSAKVTQGFADVFGGRQFNTIDYSGPASYATGGDTLDPHMFGFQNTIQFVWVSDLDQTSTYSPSLVPVNNGITVWKLKWFTNAARTTEVTAATNLSAVVVKMSAVGF